jgi:o-succinylbenzoate synthase
MKVVRVSWCRYCVPLRSPLRTARGETRLREGLILRLEAEGGLRGTGEAAPDPQRGTEVGALASVLADVAPRLMGLDLEGVLDTAAGLPPPLAFALETAALDVVAQSRGLPLARLLSPTSRPHVAVNALVTGTEPQECARQAREAVSLGYRCLKVKVGALPWRLDLQRLAAVREAAGPDVALRVDANGAWQGVAEAARSIAALASLGLQYVEQPLPPGRWAEMARLRREAGVPIAADEDVSGLDVARALLELGAADVLVLKPSAMGGLGAALTCAALCQRVGAAAVVTTALETAIGTAACLHLAAALPGPPLAAGLATVALLSDDLAGGALVPRDGRLALPSAPGLGLVPDGDALVRCASPWEGVG